MTPPLREIRALINIIEAESDKEARDVLIEAARTALRRLRSGHAKKGAESQAVVSTEAAEAAEAAETMTRVLTASYPLPASIIKRL